MAHTPPPYDPKLLRIAHRKGALAFGLIAGLQAVFIVGFVLLLMPLIYWFFLPTGNQTGFVDLLDGVQWYHLSVGYLGGAIPLLGISIWTGRWAGRRIIIQGKPYARTGFWALQWSGICATIIAIWISSIDLLGNPFFEARRYPGMFWETCIYCPLVFYLPTIFMGVLAGLLARQMGQQAMERLRLHEDD